MNDTSCREIATSPPMAVPRNDMLFQECGVIIKSSAEPTPEFSILHFQFSIKKERLSPLF